MKHLTRKRQEKLLSQKRSKMRIRVIGRIFTSLRCSHVNDWCITESFKLLWSVMVQELPSHTESSLAVELVLIVLKRVHMEMEQWMLKNRYPHCKQGMPLVAPLLSFAIDSYTRRKTILCSMVILIRKNPSHIQYTSGQVAKNSGEA